MFFRNNPRDDLPPPTIQPRSFAQHRLSVVSSEVRHVNKRLSTFSLTSKPRSKSCHDWIFSSATNVHIAVDESAFKDYIPFDSYVLALSDDRPVHVAGVGSVELKIRRRPGSKESHVILLTKVLHVPTWLCNIFSDVYFDSGHDFEHVWRASGVQLSKHENTVLRAWGYTEPFCSLDRLVLAKCPRDSRSPMLEDQDREVFSINIRWPLSQRDRWDKFLQQRIQLSLGTSEQDGSQISRSPTEEWSRSKKSDTNKSTVLRRATLSNLNAHIVRETPSKRFSSLKATASERNLPKQTH